MAEPPRNVPGGEDLAWTVRRTDDGSFTLVHPGHGEACHSSFGAWREARERYVEACRLRELMPELGGRPLQLLDVGTGVGWNIAAALEVALEQAAGSACSLEVTTLELEPSVIECARAVCRAEVERCRHEQLELPRPLELLAAVHAALEEALTTPGPFVALGERARLRLLLGDGRESLAASSSADRYDAVFLDAFSPGVDPGLWGLDFARELAARMRPEALLSTYTVSIGARLALRAAGLGVGQGAPMGPKAAGTLASHRAALPELDARSQRRLVARLEALRAAQPCFRAKEGS